MSAIVLLSIVSLTQKFYIYIVKILNLLLVILTVIIFSGYMRQVTL
jgi:hypothetical protein